MNLRRIVGATFLGAVSAALGIGLGIAPTSADAMPAPRVVPAPATDFEVVPSFITPTHPKCLDVAHGSTTNGASAVSFHCQGTRSQHWEFFSTTGSSGQVLFYQLRNDNSGMCLAVGSVDGAAGSLVVQSPCNQASTEWQVSSPIVGNEFILSSIPFPSECASLANSSGADFTPIVLQTCNPGTIFDGNVLQTWELH